MAALPLPMGLVEVFAGELSFPISDPFFESKGEVARRAEECKSEAVRAATGGKLIIQKLRFSTLSLGFDC